MPANDKSTSSRSATVLWADDQPDVAATLARLLPSALNVEFAADGEAALGLIRRKRFDMAIVDLAMPPGTWGGLWLIEQLRARGSDLPVLVLSGEGSQTETIAAMRLGADYVRKDNAADELGARVAAMLAAADAERAMRGDADLPFPVAISWRKARAAGTPTERLGALVRAAEWALRYRALCAVAILNQHGVRAVRRVEALRSPAFGDWVAAARFAHNCAQTAGVELPHAAPPWKLLQRCVERRNDLHHGADVSPARAGEEAAWVAELAEELIADLANPRLVLAQGMTYDGAMFQITVRALTGSSPTFETTVVESQYPVATGVVYLAGKSGLSAMNPWITVAEQASDPFWQVLMFDSLHWTGHGPLPSTALLRYTDVWTGERNLTHSATVSDLRPFEDQSRPGDQ